MRTSDTHHRQPSPGGDILQGRLDDMSVIVDAELIVHGQEHGIGLANSFVFRELVNKNTWLGGVAAAENGS
jgi:hypothetical protein